MDGYVIIDIVISFSFIFLTYSLLTSILVEIMESIFNLRARNLRKTIKHMLQSGAKDSKSRIQGFLYSEWTEKQFVKRFFSWPSIKLMGKNKLYKSPSFIDPKVFSQTIVEILTQGKDGAEQEAVKNVLFPGNTAISDEEWKTFLEKFKQVENKDEFLDQWMQEYDAETRNEAAEKHLKELTSELEETTDPAKRYELMLKWKDASLPPLEMDLEVRHQLQLLYTEAQGDMAAFKTGIENWFNEMMHVSGAWYKRWTARIAFFLGLTIAMLFNVDTLYIGNQLVHNEGKRTEFVAKIENLDLDTTKFEEFTDSLGYANKNIMSSFSINHRKNIYDCDTTCAKCCYDWRCGAKAKKKWNPKKAAWAFLGWIITAIAVSFGAPFWFDLLNKFMRFKGSIGSRPEKEKKQSS